jgi:hypothetical protein
MRHWYRDNSLRFVQIHFLADVGAGGTATYSLKDDGPGTAPSTPVTVNETGNLITVNTGALKFTVRKDSFNLFNEVYLMPGDVPVVTASMQQGGVVTDQNDAIEWFSGRTIDSFAVEEAGPMRAVIRVEGYTTSYADSNQHLGFICRLYAYAGTRLVKVDMGLINGEQRTWGYPIYFKDFSLVMPLGLTSPTVRMGTENSVYSSDAAGGRQITQWDDDDYKITNSAGSVLQSGTTGARGWIDIQDAAKGVFVTQRNFWQTFPNGLEYDDQGKLRLRMWPAGTHEYTFWGSYQMNAKTSDLYWLDDMVGVRKEVQFYFHGPGVSDQELIDLDRNFQWNPVASVPFSWHHQLGVTLDFGGYMPNPTPDAASTDTLTYSSNMFDKTSTRYNFGWNEYLGATGRRYPCGGGGGPSSYANFMVTGDPGYYFQSEARSMGDINLRTQWCPGWNYEKHQAISAMAWVNYCSGIWRATSLQYYRREQPPHQAGTETISWRGRDLPHLWTYHLEDYYNFSGDPWVRDLMEFWLEYFKTFETERMTDSTMGSATRGVGHSLGAFLMAMRMVGKTEYLDVARSWIHKLANIQSKAYGQFNTTSEAPFQLEFLSRAIISYMQMVEGTHPVSWLEAFGVVFGNVEWNTYYANYCYYWQDTLGMLTGDTVGGTGASMADVVGWMIRETRHKPFMWSINKIWTPGSNPYLPVRTWDGDWYGRYTVGYYQEYMQQSPGDTTPPPAISDLGGTPNNNGVSLHWTVPAGNVKKYHVRWAFQPIKEGPDSIITDSTKWWAAFPGCVHATVKSAGAQEAAWVDLPIMDTLVYFAVRSFDTINNISAISNLYSVQVNITAIKTEQGNLAGLSNSRVFPNPFSSILHIVSPGMKKGSVLGIYDVKGQLIKQWNIDKPGIFKAAWDGKGITGRRLPSQLLIMKINSGNKIIVRKFIYIR